MSRMKWWFLVVLIFADGLIVNTPLPAQAFTLDGYFKLLALAAKKRDIWRKIFFGRDLGFVASPWLFKDKVKPPFVPIVKSFPRYPEGGHYWNERRPSFPRVSFPQFYSHLKLSPQLPPPPSHDHRNHHARSYDWRNPRPQQTWNLRQNTRYPGGG